MSSNGHKNLYVQWGCGQIVAEGWLNYDASLTVRFERLPLSRYLRRPTFPACVRYGDIAKGLPLSDNSCAAVYSSHVIEHLSLEEARAAFRNTHKILQPGGVFRLVMPSLEACARGYLESTEEMAAHDFMRYTHLGTEQRPKTALAAVRAWLGRGRHLWMWDYKSLGRELTEVGFTRIRKCTCGDSSDPMFSRVEAPTRFDYGALAVECFKPS